MELVPESVEGWLKIFALCRENDITPIALILPRFDGFFTGAPVQALIDFLAKTAWPISTTWTR